MTPYGINIFLNARSFVLIAIAVLFAGCASTQQYHSTLTAPDTSAVAGVKPSVGKAKICVLRRSSILGAGIAIKITDSGRLVGRIGSGGKLIWEREPGQVVIGASASNESNISVTTKPDEVYFLEVRTNWGAGFNTAASEIRLLSREEGASILNGLNRNR
jgi:hypothetical protein